MISIGIVKSGSAVYQYFIDQDNYYLTDKSELVDGAYWHGKGADKLGIQGKIIEEKLFLNLLSLGRRSTRRAVLKRLPLLL